MQIRTAIAAAAISLAATIGSASAQEHVTAANGTAAERFNALAGISARTLDSSELAVTSGRHWQRYNRQRGNLRMIGKPHGETADHGLKCVGGSAPVTMGTDGDVSGNIIASLCGAN